MDRMTYLAYQQQDSQRKRTRITEWVVKQHGVIIYGPQSRAFCITWCRKNGFHEDLIKPSKS